MMPAMAIAILVVGGCLALVLDQLWLTTAQRELQSAANAAALAAVGELATDELLRTPVDHSAIANDARIAAANVAAANRSAGQRIAVSSDAYKDVRIGRVVINENGQRTLLETNQNPTSVAVLTHCDRGNGNPVSMFLPAFAGRTHADVVALAEASLTNEVTGIRPLEVANAPAWPIGILASSLDPKTETWSSAIELRQGKDEFSWNEETKQVIRKGDGIPEITLVVPQDDQEGNGLILDIGNGLLDAKINRQFLQGFSQEELEGFGGQLDLVAGPISLMGSSNFDGSPINMLKKHIGHTRIVLLFQGEVEDEDEISQVDATSLVAVRMLDISTTGQLEIVLQPAVVTTRTAIAQQGASRRNPYIYKLSLTY